MSLILTHGISIKQNKIMEEKIYGLFCPYHKDDILDRMEPEYNQLSDYPREFRKVRTYRTKLEQLEAFANTMCPASRTFECTKEDFNKTIEDLHAKYDSQEWLNENIYPYL